MVKRLYFAKCTESGNSHSAIKEKAVTAGSALPETIVFFLDKAMIS